MAKHGVLELQGTDRGTAAEPTQRSAHEEIEEEVHSRILEGAAQVRIWGIRAPHAVGQLPGEVARPLEGLSRQELRTNPGQVVLQDGLSTRVALPAKALQD